MYERMLDKQTMPTIEKMTKFCGDGGWIQYRVTCKEHFDDIKKLLSVKCMKV